MEITILFWGLPLITIAISYLLYVGLRDLAKVSWINIVISAVLLLLSCGWVIWATIYDLGFFAFFQILFTTGAAIFSGIFLTFALKKWRKVTGLIVTIGIPLALYASSQVAFPYSPDQVIRRNGETVVVKALNEYYIDNKAYPQNLNELVPTYVSDLREPKTIWGWLYTGNSTDFTLGYVSGIDRMGYYICKYSASVPKWDCPLNLSTAPFYLEPTPVR